MTEKTAIERLEELLNEAERDLTQTQEELEQIRAHANWGWARHTTIEAADDPLPVPRLEMVAHNISGDWYVTEWVQAMVYRHFLGHHVRVPLGHTRQTGGRAARDMSDVPFRDGAHFKYNAQAFDWPAFVIIGGEVIGRAEDA